MMHCIMARHINSHRRCKALVRARPYALAAAVIIMLGSFAGMTWGTEQAAPGLPSAAGSGSQSAAEETPFGGPPPMKRGKKPSATCVWSGGQCTIKVPQPVGTPCSCPEAGALRGVIE